MSTLPPEQTILTTVPVWAAPSAPGVVEMWLFYKTFGSAEWTRRPLMRSSSGWESEIPCLEVSTVTGDILWFLLGFDRFRGVVFANGSGNAPNRTTIRYRIDAAPPHLPGHLPYPQCPDPSDCPPGLPGCPPERDNLAYQ